MQNVDILLIDANRLFREGLRPLLEDKDFGVVGDAETMEEGQSKLEAGATPKIVLVDFDVAAADLPTFTRFREKYPAVRMVILAATADDVHSLALCFEAGADAYLLKTISPDVLAQSLTLVLTGEKVFPTRLAALLAKGTGRHSSVASTNVDGLSNRENQILRCLLSGHPNKVIAKALNITEATVKVHLKGVMKKIQVVNRTQAAIWALDHGLTGDVPAEGAPATAAAPLHQSGDEMRQPHWG